MVIRKRIVTVYNLFGHKCLPLTLMHIPYYLIRVCVLKTHLDNERLSRVLLDRFTSLFNINFSLLKKKKS